MIQKLILSMFAVASLSAFAQEEIPAPVTEQPNAGSSNRDPAQDTVPGRKQTDEELRVLAQLPEAQAKRDTHSMQIEVYKQLFNKELKPDQREDVEE
jgi:hypothetical protein